MGTKRPRLTPEFKPWVALAAVRGDKTASELTSQFGAQRMGSTATSPKEPTWPSA
jgi:hypothetical protein